MRRLAGGVLLAGCVAARASSQVYVVDSVLDQVDDDLVDITCLTAAGTCTLRAAVMQASVNPFDTTISLPAGTYLLTRLPDGVNGPDSGDLNLINAAERTIWIAGAGAARTFIDGNDLDRVVSVGESVHAILSDVTLRNGTAANGGGVLVEGGLELLGSAVTGNTASIYGGGIHIGTHSDVHVLASEIAGNQSLISGGGVFVAPGFVGEVTFEESSIQDNVVTTFGGGIYHNSPGTLSLLRTIVSGNSAGYSAGGILLAESSATVLLVESAVFDNHALGPGSGEAGGIYNAAALYVTNSTISGNRATGDGGGLYNFGSAWFYNATIASNEADSDFDPNGGMGGGVFNSPGAGLAVRNSVLAANTRAGSPTPSDCFGTIEGYGHNRFGDFSGCVVLHGGACGGSDQLIGSLTELGPLQANGGPTPTRELQPGSALIGGVEAPCICQGREGAPLVHDQRLGPRVVGARCDIGAFEVGALPPGALFSDGFESGTAWAWR